MIKITDKRKAQKTVRYRDLKMGDWYENSYGGICIKTPISENGDNCLYFSPNACSFIPKQEGEGTIVKPLEVELIVRYQEGS